MASFDWSLDRALYAAYTLQWDPRCKANKTASILIRKHRQRNTFPRTFYIISLVEVDNTCITAQVAASQQQPLLSSFLHLLRVAIQLAGEGGLLGMPSDESGFGTGKFCFHLDRPSACGPKGPITKQKYPGDQAR